MSVTFRCSENEQDLQTSSLTKTVLRSPYFAPILFAIPGDQTPNLTTITVTTNHYTPYPIQCHWSRLSHSLMAVRLMFTLCQILHHAYRTASHLGTSCISSTLYDPYLASCLSHVLLMTHTRPIRYDPLIYAMLLMIPSCTIAQDICRSSIHKCKPLDCYGFSFILLPM